MGPTKGLTRKPTLVPTEVPTAKPTEVPTKEPTKKPTPTPTEEPTAKPTDVPTKRPTDNPSFVPTKTPTAKPSREPTALAAVTVTSAFTFINMEVPDDPEELILALERSIAQASDDVQGSTTVKVTHINGKSVERKQYVNRLLQAPATPTTVVTFEITQIAVVSGDIAAIEDTLRHDVAAALDVEGAKEILATEDLQRYGDFSLGKIDTDLGDGSDPVTESASPTISSAPMNSPTQEPTTKCSEDDSVENTKAAKTKQGKTKSGKTQSHVSLPIPCPTPKTGKGKTKAAKITKMPKSTIGEGTNPFE